jgi:hypothetical protein
MKLVHVYVKFEDQFSGATAERIATRSLETFERMKDSVGQAVSIFDKQQHIRYDMIIKEIRQATPADYPQPS